MSNTSTLTTTWRELGACWASENPVFFPNVHLGYRTTYHHQDRLDEAKRICGGCRVSDECYAYAVRTNMKYGVWGGVSFGGKKGGGRQQ